jgi:hypothetical protein
MLKIQDIEEHKDPGHAAIDEDDVDNDLGNDVYAPLGFLRKVYGAVEA